jgi:uncharacterized protein
MTSSAARDTAREFAVRLTARFGQRVAWVRLYGSHARGDAHEESDVDIAAVIHDLTWREKTDAIDLGTEVSLARRMHVSPVVMSAADFEYLVAVESSFAKSILDEGVVA